MTETEKMNAYIWAAKVDPCAVPLMDLKKGEKFFFPGQVRQMPKTYCGGGWYDMGGTKFRIKTKVAVIRIKVIGGNDE